MAQDFTDNEVSDLDSNNIENIEVDDHGGNGGGSNASTGGDNQGTDEDVVEEMVPVEEDPIIPESNTGSKFQKIVVTGIEDGVAWQAIPNQTWMKVTDIVANADEDSFCVSVEANSASEVRTGKVTVIPSDNGTNGEVSVSQQGAVVNVLSVSPMSAAVGIENGTLQVSVTCSGTWRADDGYDDDILGWLSVTPSQGTGNGVVTVEVAQNYMNVARSGYIRFRADGGLTAKLQITQEAMADYVSLSSTSESVHYSGSQSITLSVDSNADWEITDIKYIAGGQGGWFHITPTSGTEEWMLTIIVDPNPTYMSRSVRVTFQTTDGKSTATYTLSQSGLPLADNVAVKIYNQTNYAILFALTNGGGPGVYELEEWPTYELFIDNIETFMWNGIDNFSVINAEGIPGEMTYVSAGENVNVWFKDQRGGSWQSAGSFTLGSSDVAFHIYG